MTDQKTASELQAPAGQTEIVNDFCITFSTINGSGSATANTALMRTFFKMGIPVSGKNIFPSNIQGLPTWFTLRLSKKGYTARVEMDDIVIAMNPATFADEQKFLKPGGVLFYAEDIKMPITREDIYTYPMPVKKLVKDADVPPALRDYIANMVYVGVLAQMLNISKDKIYQSLYTHFKGKKKAIESNYNIIELAAQWAKDNLVKKDPYRVEEMNGTEGYVMGDGNTAGALGSVFGGVQFVGWYPITPASSLAEALNEYIPVMRKDPETGKDTCVIVQSEDELAAIGMSIGAGWAGLRSMTSTSGPGLSLMAEYLGLAYYAEVPVVVWDVQRVGPSTGLPTRTAQGDITQAYFHSHGDCDFVMLFPGSVNECFEYGWRSLDIAERLQTPVIVMSDLDLGMNQWITKKFEYPETPLDRGKVLNEEELEKKIQEGWGRYKDMDGDGIPYRTIPGNMHKRAAYFARGTGHDEYARYSEDATTWERGLQRLKRKFETAKNYIPKPEIFTTEGAKIGIIACGSADPAVVEARDILNEMGVKCDYLRVRAVPFHDEVHQFVKEHDRVYVVELNRDGQLKQLLTLAMPELAVHLRSAAFIDGLPLSARWIKDEILKQEA
jgi:2-oxoglutarate ferredoxin oxidoreductase subunit alpha